MLVAFIGDVHGCVLHAMSAVLALEHHENRRLDAVVQVGDFGAFSSPDRLPPVDQEYVTANPAQGDVFRLLQPPAELLDSLQRFRAHLTRPVMVVSGNHEDHDWLAERHRAAGGAAVVAIDEFGIFEHVADAVVTEIGDVTLGFLGRIDAPGFACDFDRPALEKMMGLQPGSVDVLVTHDGPYGLSTNWSGKVQGSKALTRLVEHLQPRLHVSGHYHHINGPRTYGTTTSFALANLVDAKRKRYRAEPVNPRQRVSEGSISVLDTQTWTFRYVTDEWLDDISGDDIDLDAALDRYAL